MNEVKLVYIGRLFASDIHKYLKIGNTYLFKYYEKSYYPYFFVEYMDYYPLTAEEIKECFVSLEKWREQIINKILNNE